MNTRKLIAAIFLAALLSACESPAPVVSQPEPQSQLPPQAPAQSQSTAIPPKSSLATIYVLRTNSSPNRGNVQIGVDGKTLMSLPDNRYTWFQVPVGVRVLSAGYPSTPDMTARLTMILSSGQTYILRYSAGDRGTSLSGKYAVPVTPGTTARGRFWTRLELLTDNDISRWAQELEYVATNP